MPELTFKDLKEREHEARKELIVRAAQRLFSRQSFKTITVREIAAEAGVSPATIYRYYENLDDLFLEIFYLGTKEVKELLADECLGEKPCTIRKLSEVYVRFLNDNISFFQMMSHFMPRDMLSEDKIDRINPMLGDVIGVFAEVIKASGYTGDTEMMSRALFSALNGIMTSYAQYPGRSMEEVKSYTLILAGFISDFFVMGARREYY